MRRQARSRHSVGVSWLRSFSLTSDRNRGNCGAARNADDGTGDDSGSARYACCGLNCVIVVLRLGRDSAALEPGYVSASGKGGARVDGLAGDGEKHLFLFGRIVRYRDVACGDGLLQFAPVVGDGA